MNRYRGKDDHSTVARKVGVSQSTVSHWLAGDTRPDPPAAAAFARAYRGNVLEAFVAAGYLTREEAGMPPEMPTALADVVDADPYLSPEAKSHLKNQYGLLKVASRSGTAVLSEQIASDPTINDDTRARLLAALTDEDPPKP